MVFSAFNVTPHIFVNLIKKSLTTRFGKNSEVDSD